MKTEILVIGRHEEIVQTVLRIINKNGQWNARSALTDEQACYLFDTSAIDIVLLSSGISEEEEQNICSHFTGKDPSVIIIQHYGGGSGLLSNEIHEAMDKRR